MGLINVLIIAALVATVTVLVQGLRSKAIGGTNDQEHAQKINLERVGLQALVVVLLIVATVLLNV